MNKSHRSLCALAIAGIVVVSVASCTVQQRSAGDPAAADLPTGTEQVDLDPADFSTTIDNPYWPMTPGTRWTYREDDGTGRDLNVTVIVTTETKRIANGVTARVVRDTVRSGDEIVEDTLDWYAQDSAGAIWYLGEDTAEFDNGTIISTGGSFEAGVDGALPGIALRPTRSPDRRIARSTTAARRRTTVKSSVSPRWWMFPTGTSTTS
ncbi:hypothetical protein [Cryobacterium sp.]|jgi:hypothetical protein|uniref:hypothetical protein n=1 Tax=Cryobacterium sp. TaxID=1926290 RepID=UPI0026029639|nr:hypothetical protein [Cryobacterium sp.]MCU1445620.1 hypothetical protein [Cryobacterium sp.]